MAKNSSDNPSTSGILGSIQMKPYAQQWPAFEPGFQQQIADQLSAGYGVPASDYMAQMNQTYAPMNFMQYRYPLDALLDQGYNPNPATPGTGTPGTSGLTWDQYKELYKHGDGSKYPAGMNQRKFNAWLAGQGGTSPTPGWGTAPSAPSSFAGANYAAPSTPTSGWGNAGQASATPGFTQGNVLLNQPQPQQPQPSFYGSMEGRDALRRTGGLF